MTITQCCCSYRCRARVQPSSSKCNWTCFSRVCLSPHPWSHSCLCHNRQRILPVLQEPTSLRLSRIRLHLSHPPEPKLPQHTDRLFLRRLPQARTWSLYRSPDMQCPLLSYLWTDSFPALLCRHCQHSTNSTVAALLHELSSVPLLSAHAGTYGLRLHSTAVTRQHPQHRQSTCCRHPTNRCWSNVRHFQC